MDESMNNYIKVIQTFRNGIASIDCDRQVFFQKQRYSHMEKVIILGMGSSGTL